MTPKILIASLALIAAQAVFLPMTSFGAEGGHGGSGGGGLLENGAYKTFYQAGLYVHPVPKTLTSLPTINQLVNFINASPYLEGKTKVRLLEAVLPAENRNYFDVRADKFAPEVEARIKAEYERVTGSATEKIVLYAVTDTKSHNTYLLPSFYSLNAYGQMAILFHEAAWILKPDSTYSHVIGAEMAFQAHLEEPNDFVNAQRFVRLVGNTDDEARFTYNWDRKQGVITADGRIVDGSRSMVLSSANLIGSSTFVTGERAGSRNAYWLDRLGLHAVNNALRFPNSKFLEFFRDKALKHRIRIDSRILNVRYQGHCDNESDTSAVLGAFSASTLPLVIDDSRHFSLVGSLDEKNFSSATKQLYKECGGRESGRRVFVSGRIFFQ